ncbi:MAG TPA: hypothetical protein VGF07_05995 [Stellaceae bacterium]
MTYPVLNQSHPLASGMVGAWFPGYGGANCPDATGTWLPVTTQSLCAAGPLVGNAFGPAMAFDGLTQGLYATGAGMPISGASQFTLAAVASQFAVGHEFGMMIYAGTLAASSAPRCNLDFTISGSPSTVAFRQNDTGFSTESAAQPTPIPVSVAVGLFDRSTGAFSLYVNGALVQTRTGGPTGAPSFDSLGIAVRPSIYPVQTGCVVTSGSNIVTASASNTLEDVVIGGLITDTAGVIAAGTFCTDYDNGRTVTMSANAIGSSASDTLTFGPPLARLKNGTVNMGVIWNRLLAPAEIASFSGSPMAPFNIGGGPIGGGVPAGGIFRLKTPAWR